MGKFPTEITLLRTYVGPRGGDNLTPQHVAEIGLFALSQRGLAWWHLTLFMWSLGRAKKPRLGESRAKWANVTTCTEVTTYAPRGWLHTLDASRCAGFDQNIYH